MTDDLDRLLGPKDANASPGLRDRLREETARVVRRNRHRRWLRDFAALAASFALGATVVALASPRPEPFSIVIREAVETSRPSSPPEFPPSPRDLELAAEQAEGAERARLYLAAGRSYGRDLNDWPAAMRCYRNALDLTDAPPALDPTTDDWLLTKLKTERRESHANP